MTKRVLSIVAAAALAVFVPLSISTSAAEMNCRVPFSFIVNGKTLPPGLYSFSTSTAVLMVRGARGSAVVLTNNASRRADGGAVEAVFLKTGDRYDLSEIWTGDGAGREIVLKRKQLEDRARAANTTIERIVIAGM
jgi:hypothetical protein